MMKRALEALRSFTEGCRYDMHEPDEQGITAGVVGWELDNAMGNSGKCGELVVVLHNDKGEALRINLATLIALAKKADLEKGDEW